MALAAINVKKPREAQIGNCCTGNPVLRILPDSNDLRWKSQTIRPNKPPTRMDKKSHGNDTSAFITEGRPVVAVRLFHAI